MQKFGSHLEIEICPHCGISMPNMPGIWHGESRDTRTSNSKRFWGLFACGKCGGVVLVERSTNGTEISKLFPDIQDIDSSITDARVKHHLKEALSTKHAASACIVSCASAVDAMLKAKGLKTGSLYERIDQAAASHIITSEMAAWAHDVRLDANDERHVDAGAPIPLAAAAQKCVDFTFALAEYLYVLPSKVERGRKTTA